MSGSIYCWPTRTTFRIDILKEKLMTVMTRADAQARNLREYTDGKTCSRKHKPTIKKKKNGKCILCYKEWCERRSIERAKQQEIDSWPRTYVYQFKMPDGTYEMSHTFSTLQSAINSYKRKYLEVYGCDVPTHYFGWKKSPWRAFCICDSVIVVATK